MTIEAGQMIKLADDMDGYVAEVNRPRALATLRMLRPKVSDLKVYLPSLEGLAGTVPQRSPEFAEAELPSNGNFRNCWYCGACVHLKATSCQICGSAAPPFTPRVMLRMCQFHIPVGNMLVYKLGDADLGFTLNDHACDICLSRSHPA